MAQTTTACADAENTSRGNSSFTGEGPSVRGLPAAGGGVGRSDPARSRGDTARLDRGCASRAHVRGDSVYVSASSPSSSSSLALKCIFLNSRLLIERQVDDAGGRSCMSSTFPKNRLTGMGWLLSSSRRALLSICSGPGPGSGSAAPARLV